VDVAPAETFGYLRSQDPAFPVPEVQIRLLRSRSREVITAALAELDRGEPFADVAARHSEESLAKTTGGLLPYFPITERPPLGHVASQLDSGEVYGPVRDSSSFILLQLVGKRNSLPPGDTAALGRFARGEMEVRRLKEKRMATLLIAQSAAKRGYEVYADRLRALRVTSIPMLAYRFLGFGGRMFEVPFVEPQLEWMEATPPREPLLP
jgi:parvulin-like peptidyl-prolyl isomerase